MRAAVYIAHHAGPRFEEEMAKARAYCAAVGLEPLRFYPADLPQNKSRTEDFLEAARRGAFEVVVVPFPECFPTRFLQNLVGAGVGLACYTQPLPDAARSV